MTPRDLRSRLGLSQAAFARALGVSPRTVQAWEQGRRSPDRWARDRLENLAHEGHIGEKEK